MLSFVLPELSSGQPFGVSALSQEAKPRPPGDSWEDDPGVWQAPEELRSRCSACRVQLTEARRCVQLAYEADSSITPCEAARDLNAECTFYPGSFTCQSRITVNGSSRFQGPSRSRFRTEATLERRSVASSLDTTLLGFGVRPVFCGSNATTRHGPYANLTGFRLNPFQKMAKSAILHVNAASI